jgi:uroporphyrinogen decarboxylase
VQDSYKREVARRTIIAQAAVAGAETPLPDYARTKAVHLEVITLDSASCAPCQYMMEAANRAAKSAGVEVKVVEHRITTREGIAMMRRLKVANLPTICLDGKAEFISLIPDLNTLVAAIQRVARRKGL